MKTKLIGIIVCVLFFGVGITPVLSGNVEKINLLENDWLIEIVDSKANSIDSIALDTYNYPHTTYRDNLNEDIKYAYKDATGWHIEKVDDGVGVTSIAIDSNNNPHIIFGGYSGSKYAIKDATGWHIETVDNIWGYLDIALDSNDNPHITASSNELKYAYKTEGLWNIEILGNCENTYKYSIALDSKDFPHICYWNENINYLIYKYKNSTGWQVENILENIHETGVSIAIDSNDYPHISFGQGGFEYAYKDANGWHNEVVDENGYSSSIALDEDDYPHISYIDYQNLSLKYAYKNTSGWNYEKVENIALFFPNSIALDNNNLPHICYDDDLEVKYATKALNQPPSAPTIDGANNGKPGQELIFIFNVVDPNGDDVKFIIEWGDSTSDITDFITSGDDKSVSHIWDAKDTYTITAYAEDTFGNIGPSTTKQVTIPRNKALLTIQLILQWLLQRFPILKHLLNY